MKRISLVIISILVLLLAGCTKEAQAEVDGEAKNLEDLQTMVAGAKEELEELDGKIGDKKSDLSEIETEFQNRESEFSKLSKLAENKETAESELSEAESTLEKLNADIETAESELSKLEGDILKAIDEPIKLNPGFYYFGIDLDEGRYKLEAQEGNTGNVFVRGESGSIINEIFGTSNDGHSISEFTFYGSEGLEIEATIPVLLYPVE
ncbi:hypothetical protein AQ616_19045 [Oceanobacillus sp. E9]|uniref:hypothetical protein n=1 Tax=Oceanobacillus sp. E9 TaxID=1742575 RepID=UPI00084EBC83|nr:hypothetical protein [Oceanobacillus sp. E9]OEH55935.1 hypothetical protein AQ616_19045 [Oceanobacillus sp. E9]